MIDGVDRGARGDGTEPGLVKYTGARRAARSAVFMWFCLMRNCSLRWVLGFGAEVCG